MSPLSPHFAAREFACHHCGLVNVAPRLVEMLEDLRFDLGKPIVILSACRCPAHNTEVGGAPRSEHLTTALRACTAADIRVPGLGLRDIYLAATRGGTGPFHSGGVGIYPDAGFVHVDVREGMARWGQIGREKVSFARAWERVLLQEREGIA